MKNLLLACLSLCALLLCQSGAATVNFTGLDPAMVESSAGQNFTFTADDGTSGTLNVTLVSGSFSAVAPGAGPDATGFDVSQHLADNSTPPPSSYFIFTLSAPETFTVTQNESLTNYETNELDLLPYGSAAWTVLSATNVIEIDSANGSNVNFLGTTNQAPYGNYELETTSDKFQFAVTGSAGLFNYGSAISVDIIAVPEPGPAPFVLGGAGLLLWLSRRRLRRV